MRVFNKRLLVVSTLVASLAGATALYAHEPSPGQGAAPGQPQMGQGQMGQGQMGQGQMGQGQMGMMSEGMMKQMAKMMANCNRMMESMVETRRAQPGAAPDADG